MSRALTPSRPLRRSTLVGLGLTLIGLASINPAAVLQAGDEDAPAEPNSADTAFYKGCKEASGAVCTAEGQITVASDEDNILRVYELGKADPIATIDLDARLADPDETEARKRKVDIEAATRIGGVSLWIGSHSRTAKKGKLRPGRFRLFALELSAEDPAKARFVGDYRRLLHDMVAADKRWGLGIGAAFGELDKATSRPGPKDKGGFNIEGLTVLPDGETVYVGLRNPLATKRKACGEAILIHLRNPLALVTGAAKVARLGEPVLLDLAGRGIRSIEWSPHHKAFLIVAGDWGPNKQPWRLYKWSGERGAAPTRVSVPKFEGPFKPEALVVFPGSPRIQLLSDDGGKAAKPRFQSRRLKVD